jgi:hypothetical protein
MFSGCVFSDGDGVVANFDLGFEERFGVNIKGLKVEVWQQMIADTQGQFFEELPLMPDWEYYWGSILPYKPRILTGCPRIGYDLAAEAKHAYYMKHLGPSYREMHGEELQVITCLSKEKPLHMTAPGDILFDDMIYNLKPWEKAGGKGIYFKNAHQAIYIFNKVIVDEPIKAA